ncbi:N-acetylmuramoyl-L-alanine amidase [Mesocricetus auratus]|uniref:N-acetylmuramoyl-L-alanine amidase n=1 Tax=Mesocricetus auratus TaxID=10036 RepID=A0A1U8CG21_MESAU|nr:N-acetylmuramoyl-L-alanine amidase [Mesocricetus auratus]XP_012978367.1 N-acetylmuramoyl-L-alanine amidase [Mesocricetus auratus]XP_021090479.1 N-acetylmuramoyl-L-alanine amidase [Mesocricetus auratus]XP_021090480.1 N-acetylmuramoyl-L-alanine amidase [Mesocricetus auratus]XP_040593592.1 N-acetylmuramoyl-L-alanine amidase [Mesocricetus auratus]XP_040593594.1 N-acetylmuramoyl-L-alanine amidase [Mesocricetus auratus]
MKAGGVLWILLQLLLWPQPGTAASSPPVMDSVIQALEELEQKVLVTEASSTASAWILSARSSSPHNSLHQHLLRKAPSHNTMETDLHSLSPELQALISEVAQHDIQDGQEYGVVLAPDGSAVAVEPLLVGLEAGLQAHSAANSPLECLAMPCDASDTLTNTGAVWPGLMDASTSASFTDGGATLPNGKAKTPTTVDRLLAVTLGRDLGLTFLNSSQARSPPGLGTEGCWNQLSAGRVFTLLDPKASRLTVAFLNGALDGALLGDHLSRASKPRPRLSCLLKEYYGAGVAGDPKFRSNFRRQNVAALTSVPTLAQQVWEALVLLQRLEPGHPQLQNKSQEELAQGATFATKEFTETFLGCPAILPRCRWGAAPYRGNPTPLRLPLGFLYVHHTYVPAPPCTTFQRCAANMRSMQRFHQNERHWNDIGYSFVVGSDGYVYEGRGWHWVGAHTRGHNSRGFGVAFVGNYTGSLPSDTALNTVRDVLPSCAIRAGHLQPDYKLLGHRQLVRSDCPGDALFNLLRTWPHFVEAEN